MKAFTALGAAILLAVSTGGAVAAPRVPASVCVEELANTIPTRALRASAGSAVMAGLGAAGGAARDAALADELLAGNLPHFLRHLAPVTLAGRSSSGQSVEVTICVTPDYVSVGEDADFVRVPLGLPAAARVARGLGFYLPTPKMVDAIWRQARVQLDPAPMTPGAAMTSTRYFLEHDRTIDRQRDGAELGLLTAGQKKDVVLTGRLLAKPGRVAIYGWHRASGRPIQPLSTVHGARYADYSHGVRLISGTAFVDGAPRPLAEVIADPALAPIVTGEGPIRDAGALMAAVSD